MANDKDNQWLEWYESTRSQADKDIDYLNWYENQQSNEPVVRPQSKRVIEQEGEARMAYLLLNFVGNSELGSNYHQDFYNKSLKEQYDGLAARYSQLKRFGYEQFIQSCFPVGEQREYFMSMPNFIRDNDKEANFYNNIVIRATRNNSSKYLLPGGMEAILIGDISMRYGEFIVKGIELIDGSIYKYGEMPIKGIASCAFSNKSFSLASGQTITVPEYGINLKQTQSVLTRDLMFEMCKRCYTVSEPVGVLATYQKWNDYIAFREYYLEEQGRDGIPFDDVEAITAYVVSKREYQNSPERYDEHILDDLDAIRKDDQVLVTKQFENSERFPLVRITLDKNKKELFKTTVRGKGETPEFEQKLKRFTNADISLESEDGKRRVSIDERFRFFFADIEPDYSAVEAEYQRVLDSTIKEIDSRYAAQLKQSLDTYLKAKEAEYLKEESTQLETMKNRQAQVLASEVAENRDKTIRKEWEEAVKLAENVVKTNRDSTKKKYEDKIASIKKNKAKLKDKDVAAEVELLNKELEEKMTEYAAEIDRQKELVSLYSYYVRRNEQRLIEEKNRLKVMRENKLAQNQADKRREILAEQESQIRDEKATVKRESNDKLIATKTRMKNEETIRRYYIYFKLVNDDTPDRLNDEIGKVKPKVLKYDQHPEKVKIDRQKKALANFFGGYVKNPFLSSYLFAPQDLGDTKAELPEIEFFSQKLNEKQKEAVRKAIASESIFLLQGPPGTGKTEVIAEIAAQFAGNGKRILISSETHKAIDNVFERLPKIPEIRPLRLIPSQSKKEPNLYSPERLVDNFYINISDRLAKEVDRFRHFSKHKEKFGEEYKTLQLEHVKLEKEKIRIQEVEVRLGAIKRKRDTLIDQHDAKTERLYLLQEELDILQRRIRNIETFNFSSIEDDYTQSARDYLLQILAKNPEVRQDIQTLALIYKADIERIKEEIKLLSNNSDRVDLEAKKDSIKKQIASLHDPDTLEMLEGKENEIKSLRNELTAINNKIKTSCSSVDIDDLTIGNIVDKAGLTADKVGSFVNVLMQIREILVKFLATVRMEIGSNIDKKKTECDKQKRAVEAVKAQIRDNDNEAILAKEDSEYEVYKALESGLKRKITEFFERFGIIAVYEDIAAALKIISDRWKDLEHNYAVREKENREKIPMYERILKFLNALSMDGTIEDDREKYTKKLFENANVYGLTCTSRENFRAESMESFQKYALDDLDVKRQGIDVVIIDEVSKSSFLDLLIPILYGKTVILVGDHRQLPPMYDLRNLKHDDFDGLNPSIIDKCKNDEYTKLYEECFFKTLFDSVPDRLRVTLTKQYRCHGDIMKVFNHFYGGGLELGKANQNDEKQHGLLVKGKTGRPIIESDKHIYFVDCGDALDGFERFGDSTSATNEREARVVINLAKKIDEAIARCGEYEVDKERRVDKRPSMGVICTYGDQAKNIKRKLQKNGLKNICALQDEKFIVSTVDDFQGDERDIIFVSMVRNPSPQNRARTRAEFVKKFERINVALSRARRMLVIVGAKDFLSEATINLPGMKINDKKIPDRNAYRIYDEIIKTIAVQGLLLKASEVLGEDK